jgi:hypothetical protein
MRSHPDYKPPTLEDSARRFGDDMARIKRFYGYGDMKMHNYGLHEAKCLF